MLRPTVLAHTENGTPIDSFTIKRYMRNHDRDQLWLVDVDVTGDVCTRWTFLVHGDSDTNVREAAMVRLRAVHGGDWKFEPISVRLIPQRGKV